MMSKVAPYEAEVLGGYASGKLKPTADKAERLRAEARATAIMDKCVNTRLSSVDLIDIQANALEEVMTNRPLIASVLHKHATGRLSERALATPGAKRRASNS